MEENMEERLEYVQLYEDNTLGCRCFSDLMHSYINEMNQHSHRPLPEEFQQRWIDSIIRMQGPEDRHLELCAMDGEWIGFLYGKVDHPEHKGFIKPGYGYIMEFYVRPEYRRKGFGRLMFARMEALFRLDGAKRMYLTADPVTGRPFWEAVALV